LRASESQGSGGSVGPFLAATRVALGLAWSAKVMAKNAQATPETKRFSNISINLLLQEVSPVPNFD
jgi:hypothetical protein